MGDGIVLRAVCPPVSNQKPVAEDGSKVLQKISELEMKSRPSSPDLEKKTDQPGKETGGCEGAERSLSFEQQMMEMMADFEERISHLELNRITDDGLEFIKKRLQIPWAFIALFQNNPPGFQLYGPGLPLKDNSERYFLLPEAAILSEVIQVNKPVYRPDIYKEKKGFRMDALFASESIRSDFLIPLFADRQCIGTLNIAAGEVDGISLEKRRISEQFALRLTRALKNFQLFDACRRNEANLRELTQNLIIRHESESREVAHELHDRVAQDLSTVRIACEMLLDKQVGVSNDLEIKVSELSGMLKRSIQTIRDISYQLFPPGLNHLGLIHTISQFCEEFGRNNLMNVEFSKAGTNNLKLDFNTQINLYGLIREILNHIKQHTAAACVNIRMVASFPEIILRIENDGKGFDMREAADAAFDEKRLILIEERVRLLGGKMQVQAHPEKRTEILIKIPV
jgi:signal transduction histidine kinase